MNGRRQEGQALIAVLVAMIILGALAGAVSVATSQVLRQQSGQRNASTDDLAAQSSVADAASQVLSNHSLCGWTGTPKAPPTPLAISFPNAATNVSSIAYCSRIDRVPSSFPSNLYLTPGWTQGQTCTVVSLPPPGASSREWVLFDARWSTTAGYAYVDGHNSCPGQVPTSDQDSCTGSSPSLDCLRCTLVIASGSPGTVAQVELDCDTSHASYPLYLHIRNPNATSPALAFLVPQAPTGTGSMFLIAAATQLGTRNDYEEALLSVPATGGEQLLHEALLP